MQDASQCSETGLHSLENKRKPLVLKELKKLWEKIDPNLPWEKGEYNETNTLLLDDSPYKALCNPVSSKHNFSFPRLALNDSIITLDYMLITILTSSISSPTVQAHTAIFPYPYDYRNAEDSSLGGLFSKLVYFYVFFQNVRCTISIIWMQTILIN